MGEISSETTIHTTLLGSFYCAYPIEDSFVVMSPCHRRELHFFKNLGIISAWGENKQMRCKDTKSVEEANYCIILKQQLIYSFRYLIVLWKYNHTRVTRPMTSDLARKKKEGSGPTLEFFPMQWPLAHKTTDAGQQEFSSQWRQILYQWQFSSKVVPVATSLKWIVIQSEPLRLRPNDKVLPSSEKRVRCKATVPSSESSFGSRKTRASPSRESCTYSTLWIETS